MGAPLTGGQLSDSRTGLVIRKRTGSAWERERVALVIANALASDAKATGILECTVGITKPVRESNNLTNHKQQQLSY